MKIGLIYMHLTEGGGTYQCLQLAYHLAKKHHVSLFVYKNHLKETSYSKLRKGFTIYSVNTPVPSFFYTNKVFNMCIPLLEAIQVFRMIKKCDMEVLNPHEWNAQWVGALVSWVKHIPVVWMCNDVWHIPGEEVVTERRKLQEIYKKTLGWWIDLFLTKKCDSIIVLDHRIKSIIAKYYGKEAIVVRSGVTVSEITNPDSEKNKLGLKNTFIFLCFSIFSPHRRFEDVIEAFTKIQNRIKNAKILLIGSDKYAPEYAARIKSVIKQKKLEKSVVLITDFLPQKLADTYKAICDVFIFSNERQTWGLAAVEAMEYGKPCIISKGAGVSEIIQDHQNGILFTPRDTNALADHMEQLYTDETLRKKIGTAAQKYVKNNLSWKNYAQAMEEEFIRVKKQ